MSLLTLLATALVVSAAPVVEKRQAPSGVPDYVVKYAPVVYLFSGEAYFPADIGAQVTNTAPAINRTLVQNPPAVDLSNLDQLNNIPNSAHGANIYLTSNQDPTTSPRPQYLYGTKPDPTGKTPSAISCAIITVSHTNTTLDAFFFYFYAFNFGGVYFTLEVGDHIGDWEHNMVRFENGTPSQIWYSQHSGGQAFDYAATEKHDSVRPVTYSANGTHANYATPGTHDHTIPGVNLPAGPIEDHTDAGFLWDPTLSAYFYSFDPASSSFTPYGDAPAPGWLNFNGKWGDDKIPESDSRQDCTFGIDALCQYQAGPTGPKDKDLNRTNVCPDGKDCPVYPVLLPRSDVA
ncbi:hypothetical protein PRZ48_013435 [Zasmidium cellare]|uniref:Vacuolar protein sorting-associated protein 62 n=1 Tax=Zasmidium cellare TaxID=395010 RepID=A0ABR0E108_ZASCE|nr:hypothetical protein PRZ48_013435 [Zasmidium cellare]